jgi:hypothetical protein
LQTDDPNSLLSHYRELIQLRNAHEALRIGEWTAVATDSPRVYAFLRTSDDETLLILINFDEEAVTDYNLSLETGPLTTDVMPQLLLGEGFSEGLRINETGDLKATNHWTHCLPTAVTLFS